MSNNTIAVFTYKGIDCILHDEGTSSWRLDRLHALEAKFVVCTRNARGENPAEGQEAHLSAFLIGKIKDIVPSSEVGYEDRFLIRFTEYALLNIPDVWKDRYPIRYTSLKDLGIDPATLEWKPMPEQGSTAAPNIPPPPQAAASSLTIADAKKELALTYGVLPEAIEITIRG